MYRRVVILLLLPCVLLAQLAAAIGHVHGENHDLRPHVHTNLVAGHHHEHNDGHHHHGSRDHHHDVFEDFAPVTLPTPSPDHDSDAVYVNATDAVAVERFGLSVGSDYWTALTYDRFSRAVPLARPLVRHPPPLALHVCPLYVKHRTLLI